MRLGSINLFSKLSFPGSISPSVMIPEHRLAVLLNQVKASQMARCYFHNPTVPLSLFSDHVCDRSQFPLQAIHQLSHSGEVWFVKFSHDGTRLATSGDERSVIIYDTTTFEAIHTLTEHTQHVAYVAWSPDDTRLITCSHDKTARVWDALVRKRLACFLFIWTILICIIIVWTVPLSSRKPRSACNDSCLAPGQSMFRNWVVGQGRGVDYVVS